MYRFSALLLLVSVGAIAANAATVNVPADQPTIQAGIDAAQDGDVVLVAPGVYFESVSLTAAVDVTLASWFHTTGNASFIGQTVIDAGGASSAIRVGSAVGPQTTITGLTLRNASDGVIAFGHFNFLYNRVIDTSDGIDYENGSGGRVADSVFEDNSDDALDLDRAVDVVIERNILRNNGDDGIEIRLHDYVGPELAIVIRDNEITGNGEDGIQLIDYTALSSRVFFIERNLLANNAMAGIGMMCCRNTVEDYQAASLRERVHINDNTIVGNNHGISGGDNAIALNNILANSPGVALKGLNGSSVAAYNLFFANASDLLDSTVDGPSSLFVDPLLGVGFAPLPGSPAVDAGTASFVWNGEVVLDRSPSDYLGSGPDLGAFETPPCNDGLDNDGDGWIDFAGGDPGCRQATSSREDPQCQDGVDNDAQPGTDFDGGESVLGVGNGDPDGADPQCQSFWDKREAAPVGCGMGPELVVLWPLFLVLRSRRRWVRA